MVFMGKKKIQFWFQETIFLSKKEKRKRKRKKIKNLFPIVPVDSSAAKIPFPGEATWFYFFMCEKRKRK